MGRNAGSDWAELEGEFLHGNLTLRQFAEARGLSYNTVRSRAANGRWVERRREQQAAELQVGGKELLDRLESGELSLANFLRQDGRRSVVALVQLRDNPQVSPETRARAAIKLAELGGVEAVKQDLEAERENEPLTDAEVDELYMLCQKIKGIRSRFPEQALALMEDPLREPEGEG